MKVNYKNQSGQFSYLLMEHFIMSIAAFLGSYLLILYFTGRSARGNNNNWIDYLLDNPHVFLMICLGIVFLANILCVVVLFYRYKQRFISKVQFDFETNAVEIRTRNFFTLIPDKRIIKFKDLSIDTLVIKKYRKKFKKVIFYKNEIYQSSLYLKNLSLVEDYDDTNNFTIEELAEMFPLKKSNKYS